jgi:hypothetical protein
MEKENLSAFRETCQDPSLPNGSAQPGLRGTKLGVFLIAVAFFIGSSPVAYPFHAGTFEECRGCHDDHKSLDPTSTCLMCHSYPGINRPFCLKCHQTDLDAVIARTPIILSDDGSSMTPGGDFYWLTKEFAWKDESGSTTQSPGHKHGHSVTSEKFGLSFDLDLPEAPGGRYPSANLSCISCHDKHDAKGRNFRLLGGASYNGGLSGFSFINEAPIAATDPVKSYEDSETSHVAYGSGMSEWCKNCHSTAVSEGHSHPAGATAKMNDCSGKYNAYLSSNKNNGSRQTAYLFLVPFETGAKETSMLHPGSTVGPDPGANVMCLSCHRAHASAFKAIGRWDFDAHFLTGSHPAEGDTNTTHSDVLHSYYGLDMAAKFGTTQRSFCNKCHKKD